MVKVRISQRDSRHLATYFGYPICCQTEFHTTHGIYDHQTLPPEFLGTGFIPCRACRESLPPHAIIAHININRVCSTPFPAHVGFEFSEQELAYFRAWYGKRPKAARLRSRQEQKRVRSNPLLKSR